MAAVTLVERAAACVLRASWQGAVLAVVVWVVLRVAGRRAPARLAWGLWVVVLVRLALPVVPGSRWSLFNLAEAGSRGQSVERVEVRDAGRGLEGRLVAAAPPLESLPVKRPGAWPLTWLLGALGFAAWVGWCSLRLAVSVRRMEGVTDGVAVELLARCAREMGVRRLPRLVVARSVASPALVGVVRPRLLVPAEVLEEFTAEELRLIFLHELAHQRRWDVAVNWVMAGVGAAHWFNPVVWAALARMRADRELACDEAVLSVVSRGRRGKGAGADARDYGRTSVKLVDALSGRAVARVGVGILDGVLGHKRQLKRRITMIARFGSDAGAASRTGALAGARRMAAVGAVLVLAAVALTDAAPKEGGGIGGPATRPSTRPAGKGVGKTGATPAPFVPAGGLDGVLVSPAPSDGDAAALDAALDKKIPELKFENVPFGDVMEFLRDVSSVNIVVNYKALEAAGIDRNAAVSMRLKDVPFSQALRVMLDDVGGATAALDYSVTGSVLTISTADDLARNVAIRVYDIGELISRGTDGTPLREEQQQIKAQQLIRLLQTTIAPEEWKDNGGNVGSMVSFNQKLTVTTTEMRHRQVARLLAELLPAVAGGGGPPVVAR